MTDQTERADNHTSATDQALLERVRSELDRGCDSLDGRTCSRLTSIRHAAVEQALGYGRQQQWLSWASLSSAFCLLLVVLMAQYFLRPAAEPEVLEDLELLSSEQGLEFYENLEFYQWLAENGTSA